MSQTWTVDDIDPGVSSPSVDIQKLLDGLNALRTLFSGASAPTDTTPYMWWADTTTGLLKQRNAADSAWITVGTLDSTTLGLLARSGGNLTGGMNTAKTTVASATTPDIFAVTVGNVVDYTGTTTATGFAAAPQAGAQRLLLCSSAAPFTAGANMLIDGVASGATYTVTAGDRVLVTAITTTQFRLTIVRASGQPVVAPDLGITSKSANYTTVVTDRNKLINCTGTFTLSLLPGATAGVGFQQPVKNSGNGLVTLDPDAAETLDGNATVILYPGQMRMLVWTGSEWITIMCGSSHHGFRTGDVKLTYDDTADPGWILANDTTIGNAVSGATGRANADTEALFTLLWNKIANQWASVSGGRGANAAADYAANKTLALSKALGRMLAIGGTGTVVAAGVDGDVDLTGDTFTVPSNNTTWITGMPVVFTLASGTITGLTSGNTYYLIRSSATLVQLASSLANAQNGTAIDMTAKSSPVWTLTHTYTARVLGETGGEEAHAESADEQLSHGHSITNGTSVVRNIAGAIAAGGGDKGGSTLSAAAAGGNAAMNIMSPFTSLNAMLKL